MVMSGRLTWRQLADLVAVQAPELSGPRPGLPESCAVCRGPAPPGSRRCYPCDLHHQVAQGALADLVVPIAFAVKGGPHASRLWQYKSARIAGGDNDLPGSGSGPEPGPGSGSGADVRAQAACRLLALLTVFLRDHGRCLWLAAGVGRPSHVAVVPSARTRPGQHPLASLLAPYLTLPWAGLAARPGQHPVRELDPDRFLAAPVPRARVLLIDDTWTTGATAQSAAMALRRAGARSVVIVVLGRHVGPGPAGAGGLAAGRGPTRPAPFLAPFLAAACAVHPGRAAARGP
ncbi:MAG: phosphoribosyltransferase [Actinomycetota bacterium]|nr:phosphoribosyltransferase [Actinomycetota bacterium]